MKKIHDLNKNKEKKRGAQYHNHTVCKLFVIICPSFWKKELQVKKYGTKFKRILKRHNNQGEDIPAQFWVTWKYLRKIRFSFIVQQEDLGGGPMKILSFQIYKNHTRSSEPYADFIGRIKDATYCKANKRRKIQQLLVKQLTFDSANEDCQGLIRLQRETGNVMDFLNYVENLRPKTQNKIISFRNLYCSKTCVCKVFKFQPTWPLKETI